ncbi:hypothetical protein [Cohnella soli]|uniref:Uncharacterized protein n=1 Tax=Cohnella soli TaxID=425005 RepID=A0ABW0HW15_9BACL
MKKAEDFIFNFNQRQRDFGYLQSLHVSRNIGSEDGLLRILVKHRFV